MNEKGRIRRLRKVNFTPISNTAVDDDTLSMQALGLYTKMQRYIDIPDFKLYKTFLMRKAIEGERAFNRAWKELKNAGYLKQYRVRTEDGFTYEYTLLDEPDTSTPGTINVRLNGEAIIDSFEEEDIENQRNDSDSSEPDITNDIEKIEKPQKNNTDVNTLIDEIKEQIDYEHFKIQNDPHIDSIVDIMLEVLTYPEEIIKIGKENRYTNEVKLTYKKLNIDSIEQLINNVKDMDDTIINPKGFWLTALYNAPKTFSLEQAQYSYPYKPPPLE